MKKNKKEYKDEFLSFKEIKAETIISLFKEQNFHVQTNGAFYRNFSGDLLNIKKDDFAKTIVKLSRDGVFHILPEGLFFDEYELKLKKKDYEKFKEEKEKIKLFFQPFDTLNFAQSLQLEEEIINISENENDILIDFLFDKLELNTKNEYINKIKTLLPFAGYIKGDKKLIHEILENIFQTNISMDIKIINKNENNEVINCNYLMSIVINKPDLNSTEYYTIYEKTSDFFAFFYKYFLPIELEYEFKIKDYNETLVLGKSLILDYNTQL